MSVFKIKIKPVIKERNFQVTFVKSGRKSKVCHICNTPIAAGESSVTFTKITDVGAKKKYEIYHACAISKGGPSHKCSEKLAIKLNTPINEK